MKLSIFVLCLLPILSIAQLKSIEIDTIGNNPRIKFKSTINNILIGTGTGNINSTGSNNSFIGINAGSSFTTGQRNIGIGPYAGWSITTGTYNINLGMNAGNQNLTGNGNILIGDEAGADNLGSENVYIGDLTGANAQGSRNVLIGKEAGYSLIGDDQLMIDNSNTAQPLIHGFFAKDSLVINGDLKVTGSLLVPTIDVSQITGILGSGYSAVFPVVLDNTVNIEIVGSVNSTFLVTTSVGYQIDTFTIAGGGCLQPNSGFTAEFPLTFETINAADISALQSWFASPIARSGSIIIKDVGGNETFRFNFYDYVPTSTGPGTDGRTSFTISHNLPPNNITSIEIDEYLGSQLSFNPATDKVVEIGSVTHPDFCPAVEVDFVKRVITLEMTYNEGAGLVNWIKGFANGSNTTRRAMSIIETVNGPGTTEISRENYFEVIPFKYEIIYGTGLNTKLKSRIKLLYGCHEPG